MRRLPVISAIVAAVLSLSVSCSEPRPVTWQATPPVVSDDTGYGAGVSAMYAGAAGDVLIVAGGANFPDVPAAEGGQKAFYDHIYMYDGEGWHCAGSLPAAAAYGVSCTIGGRLFAAGGANGSGAMKTVLAIEPDGNGGVILTEYPELPYAVEQAAGAAIGESLYLFGGIADGEPSAALFVLDTGDCEAGWRRLAPAPESLVQPVAAASGGRLYVWGGFDSATKCVAGRGYCYDPQCDEWSAVAEHPDGGTFTGAAAVTLADGRILSTGGVDREIFSAALRLPADKIREYQLQPVEYYRFQRALRIFDPASGEWSSVGESECTARAGASLVRFGGGVWLLGGELKPGIRTPENRFTADI